VTQANGRLAQILADYLASMSDVENQTRQTEQPHGPILLSADQQRAYSSPVIANPDKRPRRWME
jgi:hypothetical protein